LLLRSLLAMNVIMPIVAAMLAKVFGLREAVGAALILLAVSPVPPILPTKEIKAGGRQSYVVELLATSSLVAIVFVPVAIELLGRVFGRKVHVPMGTVAWAVTTSVLVPLTAGVIVRMLSRSLAERIAGPISQVATVLLVVAFIPVLIAAWPKLLAQIGDFTLVTITLLVVAGLVAGHALGGPRPDDRTALALSTASRHPGVAIAVASVIAPHEQAVVTAVLLAFLVSTLATVPYVRWRRQVHAEATT
jgi:BASS family bile acid:Na+ symporter